MNMDDTALIRMVKSNEHLYNKYNKYYKSVEKKKATWQRIARELGINETICIRRWTCMRERYSKESRRLTALVNNGMTTSHIWPLFEEMEFLKPFVIPRNRSFMGNSSFSVKVKEQPDSFITDQEDVTEYEQITEPFQFKDSASHASEQETEREEMDAFLPTDTLSSSTPHPKRPNSAQIDEPKVFHISATKSINQHTSNRNHDQPQHHECAVEKKLNTALKMFEEVCNGTKARHRNPAVHGFGEMIVETICGMSERKQTIAMQKVTELVMNLKMEPESM
ncbi:transcription factor Adf-1-like [Anastrepha ludens]|uniref:transcription factor Adf-1-like n=1 Tax=Anastrepha ludens TaxID=28586 RepID=UPI0023B205F2|nr:transcription factor Adf-1-like [Anastrepha ludens]